MQSVENRNITGVNLSLRPAELYDYAGRNRTGDADMMTVRLKEALAEADLVLGAKRLIEAVTPKLEKRHFICRIKSLHGLRKRADMRCMKTEGSHPFPGILVL